MLLIELLKAKKEIEKDFPEKEFGQHLKEPDFMEDSKDEL
jgi:hypothetical protein